MLLSLEEAGSSSMGMGLPVTGAVVLDDQLSALEGKTELASEKLLHLISVLTDAIRMDELRAFVKSAINASDVDLHSANDLKRPTQLAVNIESMLSEDKNRANYAEFSSRFSAVWAECADPVATIWFCVMDGDHFIFALRSSLSGRMGRAKDINVRFKENSASVKCLALPRRVVRWSTLMQIAAGFMDTDNEIRAVLVACIVCGHAEGDNACVPEALFPKTLKSLSARVHYDVPVDDDLMTALADPVNIDDHLYFKCGLLTLAKAVENDSGICHLKGVDDYKFLENAHEEQVQSRLPLLYGFGKFLDSDKPHSTTQVKEILSRLPKKGSMSELLWAVVQAAPDLYSDGNLDLSDAAGVIFEAKGAFLGTGKMRKIRGDVLLVDEDGIYRSSRFFGRAVAGSLEVTLPFITLGLQIAPSADRKQDRRINDLSVIAHHILRQPYRFQYCDKVSDTLVKGPPDLRHDETAVCNTLVALIARKYGQFTGFSSVVSTPCSDKVHQASTMHANIFLPVLNIWVPRGMPFVPESGAWGHSTAQVREIRVREHKVLAYGIPTFKCKNAPGLGAIEVVADLSRYNTSIPHEVSEVHSVHGE